MPSPAAARRRLAERLVRPGPARPAAARVGPGLHPATRAQQGLWLLHRMQPDDVAYNVGCVVRMDSVVPAALQAALDGLVHRQAALRTCFVESIGDDRRGSARQFVHQRVTAPLTTVDLRAVPDEAERERMVAGLAAVVVDLPFDLRLAPLLRATLVQGPGGADVVILATHHIVADGESIELLEADLRACYRTALLGGPLARPELTHDFADVARGQAERLDREHGDLSAWWRQYLRGAVTELVLPLDHDRPANPRNLGTWAPLDLAGQRGAALRAFAASEGRTPFAVVLACYAAVLGRYAGGDEVLIGVPFSGRRTAADRDIIGLYVTTLPLRISGLGDPLAELARRVQLGLAAVLDHQDYPLDDLIDEHAADRDPAVHPLFQASAVHQASSTGQPGTAGRRRPAGRRARSTGSGTIRFDLSLQVAEGGGELDGSLGGRSDLFDAATVERLSGDLLTLLDAGLRRPDEPLSAVARSNLGRAGDSHGAGDLGRAVDPDRAGDATTADPDGWRAHLAELLARQPRPRVRVGDQPVTPASVDEPGAVTLVGLDQAGSLGSALSALAGRRPLTLLDPGWPRSWLTRCLAEAPAEAGGLRVAELDADGVPALVDVPSAAVAHAIRHATEILGLTPGESLVIGGVPPSVALLLGVLPALAAGASVTLVPGGCPDLLDLVAWDGADVALVDRTRATALIGEGWDATTRVVSHADPRARLGLLGPAVLGHAAASVVTGRAALLDPVEIVAAGGQSLPGAVGSCALGAMVSGWRARLRPDGVLIPVPAMPPVLTVGELETAVRALPGVTGASAHEAADAVEVSCTGELRPSPVPDWLARCRIGPQRRPWRISIGSAAGDDAPSSGAAQAGDAATAVVRLAAESCLAVRIADLDQTFFELGGHSLLIAQLAAELSDLLDTPIGLGDVFRHPSVRALGGWLTSRSDADALAARARAVVEVATLDDAEVVRRLRAAPR